MDGWRMQANYRKLAAKFAARNDTLIETLLEAVG
jgi:hypothetical protein